MNDVQKKIFKQNLIEVIQERDPDVSAAIFELISSELQYSSYFSCELERVIQSRLLNDFVTNGELRRTLKSSGV